LIISRSFERCKVLSRDKKQGSKKALESKATQLIPVAIDRL